MSDFLLPRVETWPEWGAIYTDDQLWRPVVERVWAIDERLPRVTGIARPKQVRSGYPGTCAVFLVDGAAVIKFYPPVVEGDYDRERAVYGLLSGRVSHLPALLADGVFHDRIDWPYVVVSYIAGEPWREISHRLIAAEQRAILAELGRVIRVAHETTLPKTGAWPSQMGWAEFVGDRLPHLPAELRRTALSESIIEETMTLVNDTDWFAVPPVLLHADLTGDHPLLAVRDGRWSLVGLIDWADAMVGDPLYDAVAFWFDTCRQDAALFRAFLDGYGSGFGRAADLPDRLLAMTFLHEFNVDILDEAISPEEQRAMPTLDALRAALLGDLLR